jgi:hypothetical protein
MQRVWLLLLVVTSVIGCARSKQYGQEQNYFRSDSDGRSATQAKVDRYGQPKKKIYVLPFMNDTPFADDQLGVLAAQEMLRVIGSSSKAIVPEEIKVQDTSRDFYSADKIRLTPLMREGKKLGISLIVVGKIKRIRYRQKGDDVGLFRKKNSKAAVDMEMRMFDCTEAKEVIMDSKSADSTSSQVNLFGNEEDGDPRERRMELVQEAIKNTSRLLSVTTTRALDKINWEGRVAKISGGRVYINAGRASGLNIGDILKVMTPGEDIYDPLTGAYMGRSQGQPKGTLEIVDFLGTDGAISTIHSGGGFLEGDSVQLY